MIASRTLLFSIASLLAISPAFADTAAAEAAFRQGKKKMAEKSYDEACRLFGESFRQEASSGAAFNLAECHRVQGKTASAWAEFLQAKKLAETEGKKDRAADAKKLAAELEPQISYVTVVLAKAVQAITLKRNDTVIQPDMEVPVDPGDVALSASAPGFEPWQRTLSIKDPGTRLRVEVPELKPIPTTATPEPTSSAHVAPTAPTARATESAPPGTSPPAERHAPASSPVAGYVLVGAGGAALIAGAYFGLKSLATYKDADNACPSHVGCAKSAVEDRSRAGTQGWIATAGVGLGIIGVAVGTYLLVKTPSATVGLGPGYVTAGGAF